jgi:hypothetical protein
MSNRRGPKTGPKTSYASIFGHWEALLAGAAANRDDLPALERYRAQLEAALKEAREIQARRLGHELESRQMTQELHARIKLGRDLAARLEGGVQLLYGKRSPKLGEFGMKALSSTRPRKKVPLGCAVKGCPLEASATVK